jgi:hypothetical protein
MNESNTPPGRTNGYQLFMSPTRARSRSELGLLRQEIRDLRAMPEPLAKAAAPPHRSAPE